MALIEVRWTALGAEIEPVLGDREPTWRHRRIAERRGIVCRFRQGVLHRGGKARIKAAAERELTGVARGGSSSAEKYKTCRTSWARIRNACWEGIRQRRL